MRHFTRFSSTIILALLLSPAAFADTFGTGSSTFEISFVPIGALGNASENRPGQAIGVGGVDYAYRISTYEITEEAVNLANSLGNLGITTSSRGPNKPATEITWSEAATFVNWLNTSRGFSPAYKFVESTQMDSMGNPVAVQEFALWEPGDIGYDPSNVLRNSLANYVLPSLDEWYKAAFYDPGTDSYRTWATGNDQPIPVLSGTAPGTVVYQQLGSAVGPADVFLAGGPSLFGTVGQSGNVNELLETPVDLANFMATSNRRVVGGGYTTGHSAGISRIAINGTGFVVEASNLGFRVVSLAVPEPKSFAVAFVVIACCCITKIRKRFQDSRNGAATR
jgi:hypothetical protein